MLTPYRRDLEYHEEMSHCLIINFKLVHYGILYGGTNHKNIKFYDEMPTHVLAEYKTIGDSTVRYDRLTSRRKGTSRQ